jgi:hypothetical protein
VRCAITLVRSGSLHDDSGKPCVAAPDFVFDFNRLSGLDIVDKRLRGDDLETQKVASLKR